jgi:integrase
LREQPEQSAAKPRTDRRIEMTERWLNSKETVPAAGARREWVDKKVQGLVLRASRVSDEILKVWMVRYRPKGATQRRWAIGKYGAAPLLTLEAARQRVRKIVAAAKDGIDLPAKEAEDRRRAAEQARERRRAAELPQTVADLLDLYVAQYCKANQRRWRLVERMFENHVKPTALGKKPLAEVRRADVVELLDDLQNKKGYAAQVNRVRSQILAAFNWAIEREKIDVNPASGIKKRKGIEKSRDRVLTDDELRAIWRAADGLLEPSRSLVRAWILTGQRRDEVRCMAWTEIDLTRAIWTLPAARNKGKRDHEIPLAPAMGALLNALPRRGKPVFTIDGGRPYAGQKRLKQILDRESGVSGWTFHDFRRTASTGMAALHVPQDTIDRVLNHAKGTLAGTYNRYDYLDQKRKALDAWAERVAFIAGDACDAVNEVPIRGLTEPL